MVKQSIRHGGWFTHVKPGFQRGMRQHSPPFFILDAGSFHTAVSLSLCFYVLKN